MVWSVIVPAKEVSKMETVASWQFYFLNFLFLPRLTHLIRSPNTAGNQSAGVSNEIYWQMGSLEFPQIHIWAGLRWQLGDVQTGKNSIRPNINCLCYFLTLYSSRECFMVKVIYPRLACITTSNIPLLDEIVTESTSAPLPPLSPCPQSKGMH